MNADRAGRDGYAGRTAGAGRRLRRAGRGTPAVVPLRGPAAAGVVATAAVALAACGPGDAAGGRAPDPGGGAVNEVARIDPPAGPGSGQPRLSAASDGGVLLSWLQPGSPGGGTHELVFAEFREGSWSEPRTVVRDSSLFVNWADVPSVVPTGGDSLAAHWLRKTGSATYAYSVRVAFSPDGGRTWGEPVVPHRDRSPTEHGFVSLLPGPSGGVRAVWLDGRRLAAAGVGDADAGVGDAAAGEGSMTLRSAVIGPDGRVRSPSLVDGRVCDCCQTSAASTARGPLVVYRDRSPEEVRDIAAVRLREGAWSEPVTVHRDGWRIGGCPVNGPALDAEGEAAVVAWFTAAEGRPRVRVAFSRDAGASFAPPVEVAPGRPVGRVDVELLDTGGALVSWLASADGEGEIRVRRVAPGGAAGPARTVATGSTSRAAGFPRLAVHGDEMVVAWTDASGPGRVRAVRGRLPSP